MKTIDDIYFGLLVDAEGNETVMRVESPLGGNRFAYGPLGCFDDKNLDMLSFEVTSFTLYKNSLPKGTKLVKIVKFSRSEVYKTLPVVYRSKIKQTRTKVKASKSCTKDAT